MSNIVRPPQGIEIRDLDDLGRFAAMAVKSGLFKDVRDAAQAAVKIQAGLELGLAPMQALSSIHLVEGKPTLGAGLLAALMQRAGYSWRIVTHTMEECRLEIHREGEALGEASFTAKEAEAAGLLRRPPWQRHRKDMLFARAISRAARWYAPAVALGVYTPDELGEAEEPPAIEYIEPVAQIEEVSIPPEPSPWSAEVNELDEDQEELAELAREYAARRQARSAEKAPIVTGGSEREKAERILYTVEEIPEEVSPPEYETEDWKRASKRLHAVMREFFWSKDQIKEWLGVESTKDLDAQTLDAAAVILTCLNLEQLKNAWFNFPATVRATLTPLKDAVKAQLENQHRAGDIAVLIRAVKESECPHAKLPANIRQLPMETLQHIAGVLQAAHIDAVQGAVKFCEKTAEKGDSEKLRALARQTLDLCETVTVWKLERMGKQQGDERDGTRTHT